MKSKIIAGAAGAVCLLALAACDNTYTPGAHHFSDNASTGSHLSGADTGVNPNGSVNDPSITSNFGSGATGSH